VRTGKGVREGKGRGGVRKERGMEREKEGKG